MQSIKILGTGYSVPAKKLTNFDLEKQVETSDEWIITRTGIKERRIAESETTLSMSLEASKTAIKNSKIDKKDIGLIIVATITPDNFTPATACLLQEQLGLNGTQVMAFDINAACSGFVYALEVAKNMLPGLPCKYALVVGAETLSKITDFTDRTTCILFGDGAGAAIVESKEGVYHSYHNARGNWEALNCPGVQVKNQVPMYLSMLGTDVFKFAVEAIPQSMNEVLKGANLTLDDIDYVVCHQANSRIIGNVCKRYKSDFNKFYVNIDKYGNTSAASIPLALAEMDEKGLLKEGMKLILVGFGGGLTWGAVLLEW